MKPLKISASAYSTLDALTRWYEDMPECLDPSDDFHEEVWDRQQNLLPEEVDGYDVMGVQLVTTEWLDDMRVKFDVSGLRPGMLVVELANEDGEETFVEVQGA